MMKKCFVLLSLFTLFSFYFEVRGQSQEKIYSVMMMNFAKGMQWPASASKGNFVIGVLEYPPLAIELAGLTGNLKLGNRKVEVREFDTPESISDCHILFVPAYKARRFPDVLSRIGNFATLIVTNKIDYARKGAGINFVLIGGKLKYEINSKAIEKRGVKVSSDLKGLGIPVD
jgi:hypothetical protein